MGVILPAAQWRTREGMDALLTALDAEGGQSRFVGGAVRDTLLGHDVQDVDIATRLMPQDVMQRLKKAGIKAIPTGIEHGTITAVLPHGPVEVTTLRRDVSTDGRRATVAFSDDWREDAARRDFTINALYADPVTDEIHDYFGGLDDLEAHHVRFIGDALTRIAEDHLRILRFFRFHARFGTGTADAAAIEACQARARDLMALSRERIADELLKLLALPDPTATIRMMIDLGIFTSVIPEITDQSHRRLIALIDREKASETQADPLRRLIALSPADGTAADEIAARLRLSNAQRKRIGFALEKNDAGMMETYYRKGAEAAQDRLLLSDADPRQIADALALLHTCERPKLPLGGGALVSRGLKAGPVVAKALQTIERRWIDENFPSAERVDAMADEVVAELLATQD